MNWLIFVCGAVLAWGMYGVTLHRGQAQLASPLRALLCVGFAYFLIAVLVPSVAMWSKGEFAGFTTGGTVTAILAGCLGAAGAICIIWAFKSGGKTPVRHAAGFWRRSAGERLGLGAAPSSQDGPQSVALPGVCPGSPWGRHGSLFQAHLLNLPQTEPTRAAGKPGPHGGGGNSPAPLEFPGSSKRPGCFRLAWTRCRRPASRIVPHSQTSPAPYDGADHSRKNDRSLMKTNHEWTRINTNRPADRWTSFNDKRRQNASAIL